MTKKRLIRLFLLSNSQNKHIMEMETESIRETNMTLDNLVAQITILNRHTEVNWGKSQGKEIW